MIQAISIHQSARSFITPNSDCVVLTPITADHSHRRLTRQNPQYKLNPKNLLWTLLLIDSLDLERTLRGRRSRNSVFPQMPFSG